VCETVSIHCRIRSIDKETMKRSLEESTVYLDVSGDRTSAKR
jgi:hypothetical protein